jgi:NIPSNAP
MPPSTSARVVEIRTLTLRPGARAEFQRLFTQRSLPLLRRWGFDVVAYGPSLHDEVSFYVIRAFADLADRQALEDAFYASDDWRQGPREPMLALVESYSDAVFEVEPSAVAELRRDFPVAGTSPAITR